MDTETQAQIDAVRNHPLFDAKWYRQKYKDVERRRMDPAEHYVLLGGRVQYQPSEQFDLDGYLKAHPELRYNRVPALLHMITTGGKESGPGTPQAMHRQDALTGAHFTGKSLHDLRLDQFKHAAQCSHPMAQYDRPSSISAVIPTAGKNLKLLDKCLESLSDVGEILLVVNGPAMDALEARYADRCRVVKMEGAFNWSAANNVGVKMAKGEYILFCNDDIEAPAGWATRLLNGFYDERAKIVAPVLHHPDGRVQSAGCYRVPQGCTSAHITFAPVRDYFVESIMGAAFMVRKSVVDYKPLDIGFQMVMAETDFCLRVGGCLVKHDVHVTHHERTSRGPIDPPEDIQRFIARHPLPTARLYPSQWIPVGRNGPLRVLMMKLDHIGDAEIARAAVEQWSKSFGREDMQISWLVNPVSAPLFSGRDVFTYTYFKEDASDGLAPQKPGAWESFVRGLPTFDVVIDLRLHGCTTKLLKAWDNTGTICYAMGLHGVLPYNSINPKGVRHARQITSGFLASLPLYTPQARRQPDQIVVCRAVSGYIKEWPRSAWQALVEALSTFGKEVVELLPPGTEPLEGTDGHISVPLGALGECAAENALIYIGHDSGPTHIAAQAGVPVVEIVGGLVASLEWQGVGDSVSVSMPQPCGPCYVNPCRQGSPVCIQSVDVASVIYAVRQIFQQGGGF